MGRRPRQDRLGAIFGAIISFPGSTAGAIAGILGLNRSEVTRMLPSLEDNELYVSEDEDGGLWAYGDEEDQDQG